MSAETLTMVPEEVGSAIELPLDDEKLMLAEMLALGKSTEYISANLSRSAAWVRKWKKDPGVVALVNELHTEAVEGAKATIISGTQKAAATLVELVEQGPSTVRLAAAKDILDRIGMKAPDRKQIEQTVNVTTSMSREDRLARILERANRLGLEVPAHLRGSVIQEAEVVTSE